MTIRVNPLDPDSIDEAIAKIEEYETFVAEKANELVRLLKELGVEKAKELVPIDTGQAQASIIGYMDENKGIIQAGGYCKYIEFGTGVRGQNSQHPSPEYLAIMQWAYNSGATIFTTKDGREGWYYPTDDGGYRFTEGMPSRPFMFETAQYLKREASRLAKEAFANGEG